MAKRKRTIKKRRKRRSKPSWSWLFAGLALGTLIASVVYSYAFNNSQPQQAAVSEKKPANVSKKKAPADTVKSEPEKKPRFDFYTILPEMEVIIPENSQAENRIGGTNKEKTPASYLLQAGSFRHHEEADQLKARLALLGIESQIQTVDVSKDETWHRIRIGPFQEIRQIDKVRRRLWDNDINPLLVRVK